MWNLLYNMYSISTATTLDLNWDQALFSFRFENYIPEGKVKQVSGPILAVAIRENVWEPLKLGLISGYPGLNFFYNDHPTLFVRCKIFYSPTAV